MGRRMTVYLQQVKGSRGSFVLVLAGRDGRARESLNRKDARERRQSMEWEVVWDLEITWRREPWTEGRTPSAGSGGTVGTDVAALGWMLGSCGRFQVMTSVLFVMHEVRSSTSERHNHWPASPSLTPSLLWPSVTTLSASPSDAFLLLPLVTSLSLSLGHPLLTIPHTFVLPKILGRPRRSPQFLQGRG